MKNKRLNILIVFLFILLNLFLIKTKSTYGIYRDVLNTKIYLSVLNSENAYTITFDSQGGSSVESIIRTPNSKIGPLPTPIRKNYNFIGWYTQDGKKIEIDTIVEENTTYYAHWKKIVCKKAMPQTLHTETCYKSDIDETTPGCYDAGYTQNETITYGTIPEENNIYSGDAYACDINDDDIYDDEKERFYYIRKNNDSSIDTVSLIHYTNFDEDGKADSSISRNTYTYETGKTYLPDSTLWTNSSLINFNGKVSRYPSKEDLEAACGEFNTNEGFLDACQYFLETSGFQSNTLGKSTIWMEKINSEEYKIDTKTRSISKLGSTATVRPVIEIPYDALDGYHEKKAYTVTFDTQGGTSVSHIVRYENEKIGELSTPTKENYVFGGWYTDTSYNENIDEDTLIVSNVTYYAKWDEIIDNMQTVFYIPGSCIFNGSKTISNTGLITSDSPNGCISIVNPTNQEIDYTDKNYIDTGISLFSNENFEKDFEVGVTVDTIVMDSTVDTQATLINSKLENSSKNYPGFVVRRTSSNYIEMTEKFGSSTSYGDTFSFTQGMQIKVSRQNGIMYYAIDDGEWQYIQDINEFTDRFNLTTWFGATSKESDINATGENSSAMRYYKGKLSNMYIKLEKENLEKNTVLFDAHGGNASFVSKEVVKGKKIGVLPSVIKSGHYFDGWYTKEVDGRKIDENEIIGKDITLHAQYKNIFLVTFNTNGGTLSDSQNTLEVIEGEKIEALPKPSLPGYVFDGWYNINGIKIDETESIIEDITYYAHYKKLHTITFDSHGGTLSISPNTTIEVADGEKIQSLPTATLSGHIFDGWYSERIGGRRYEENELIYGNNTYHAQWIEKSECTVTFNTQGGSDIPEMNVPCGNSIGTLLNNPIKNGYIFNGWYEEDMQTLVTPTTIIPKNITYYAKWSLNPIYVAQINDKYYEYLEDAFEDITTNTPTTIIILQDIAMTKKIIIPSSRDITLNIGNHILSNSSQNVFENNGILRIHDGIIRDTTSQGAINNNEGAKLYISGGTIENTSTRQAVYNKGYMHISNDAYLRSNATERGALDNDLATATIEMTGGTIESINVNSKTGAIRIVSGTVKITGGTVISNSTNTTAGASAINNAGTLIIGEKNNIFDIKSPEINAKRHGVYSKKNYSVFDGIIRGSLAAVDDESKITQNEENAQKINSVQEISGVTYNALYYELIN